VSLLVYLRPATGGVNFVESPYPFFPILIWAALRFDQRGASTTMLVVSLVAIMGTAMGHGPFVKSSLHASLLALQTFMPIAAGTSLLRGVVSSERRRATEALRAAHRDLESRVEERTAEVTKANAELLRREAQLSEAQELAHIGAWEWDIRSNVLTWTDELYR